MDANGSDIKGVWYTQTPWGVGGEGIIRNKGLYFYDYTNGAIKRYLDDNQNFQGLSPDHSMAAIIDESVVDKPVLKVMDFSISNITILGVEPSSDHGAG